MKNKEFLEFKSEIIQTLKKSLENTDKLIEIVGKNVENINYIMAALGVERRLDKFEYNEKHKQSAEKWKSQK